MSQTSTNVTQLLRQWSDGSGEALERLIPIIYEELRGRAAGYLRRERPGHTLQPTALVHEAYLRLAGAQDVPWQNRTHFFAIAATLMRRILVEHARKKAASKRGGAEIRLTLDENLAGADKGIDLLAVDQALERLAAIDAQQARVVELRFFSGLSVEESAEALGVSPRTVKRDWSVAKAWLHRELSRE
ncbi:MAG TPA: sigma-70 family RNA polymerase sigma factor [Pyrinomonadaceae bacterium]|nr:sigma-70 family RNA polymerase sigma factor [Pyrinomonadaceae bacterium]